MIFKSIHNQFAELYIMGIDRSPMVTEKNDLWLKVFINVSAPMGKWEAMDTALTLNDVRKLIRWLEDLSSAGKETAEHLYFTEPNLSFLHVNTRETGKTIKINFNNELRPEEADETVNYFLTCRITNVQLRDLAGDLAYDLQMMFDKMSGVPAKVPFRLIKHDSVRAIIY